MIMLTYFVNLSNFSADCILYIILDIYFLKGTVQDLGAAQRKDHEAAGPGGTGTFGDAVREVQEDFGGAEEEVGVTVGV